MRSVLGCWMLVGCVCGCRQAQPHTAGPSPRCEGPTHTRLDLRISPLVNLHYFVRKCAVGEGERSDIAGFDRAVAAARRLQSELRLPLLWGLLEGALIECDSAAELVEGFARLPETKRLRSGGEVRIRAAAVRYAEALAAIEQPFLESVWPGHKARVKQAAVRIRQMLGTHEAECVAYIAERLGMHDPCDTIPVYLVAEAPFPQGFTHRRRGGGGVCFIGVEGQSDSLLCEMILHEAIHALDVATEGQDNVLSRLRQRLRGAGLTWPNRLLRDVPHTLIFMQAAETVRRLLDADHQHYGEVAGYYAKVPEAACIVRPTWTAYLDAEITRDEALERMVADAVAISRER